MQHKILFTSDLHGNIIQYLKLIEFAKKISAESIIIGGDIAPKNFSREDFIKGQKEFFEKDFQEIMKKLKASLPNSKVFLMMGNDDCASNLNFLKKGEPKLYHIIHNKRLKLTNDFEIVGYSFVPITPFGIKDWEKYDFSNVPKKLKEHYFKRKESNYRLNAKKSSKIGWKPFNFTPEIETKDSIQKDLSKETFTKKPNKTLYVIHSPPDKTNLDQVAKGVHVGSLAVKEFIEEHQPFLTLHGHIHETVDISGEFRDAINNTLCLASGNHNIGEELAVLVFDLYNPQKVERIVV